MRSKAPITFFAKKSWSFIAYVGKNRCGPVSDIENGSWELVTSSMSVGRHSYRLGSVIRYSCDEGYALYGTVQRVCQADGTWSDATPSCRVSGLSTYAFHHHVTRRNAIPSAHLRKKYNTVNCLWNAGGTQLVATLLRYRLLSRCYCRTGEACGAMRCITKSLCCNDGNQALCISSSHRKVHHF